jgi:MFS family permease
MSRLQPRRAAAASLIGTAIEYYDFFIYATAAALVFNKVFFPAFEGLAGTLVSLSTFAVAFLVRPIGGIVIGHLGDRIGRRPMLVFTLVAMGAATLLIGLLPGYAQLGAWAPVLLVALRVVQGIAVGGEWAGAVLLSAEHATSRRGLWASFTSAGAPSGLLLSTVALTISASALGEQEFLAWGWRIPFLLSAILLVLGLVVRAKVEETPVFRSATAEAGPAPWSRFCGGTRATSSWPSASGSVPSLRSPPSPRSWSPTLCRLASPDRPC